MTITRHEHLIRGVLAKYPTAKTTGFGAEVRRLLLEADAADEDEIDLEKVSGARRPDAYILDEDEEAILAFEVEDTSLLTDVAFGDYTMLAMHLRDIGFRLHLVMVSRWGAEAAIDMTAVMEAGFARVSELPAVGRAIAAWRKCDCRA